MSGWKDFEYDPNTGILTRWGEPVGHRNWDGYLMVKFQNKSMRVHRVAFFLMTGRWPTHIDHINRVRTDNRWNNLREVQPSQNSQNRKPKRWQRLRASWQNN